MEKRLVIFFMTSTAFIVAVGIANHRLPAYTWLAIATGICIRLLLQYFIKKRNI